MLILMSGENTDVRWVGFLPPLFQSSQAVYKGKVDLKEIPSYNTNIEVSML
jgi:hypothetical protein